MYPPKTPQPALAAVVPPAQNPLSKFSQIGMAQPSLDQRKYSCFTSNLNKLFKKADRKEEAAQIKKIPASITESMIEMQSTIQTPPTLLSPLSDVSRCEQLTQALQECTTSLKEVHAQRASILFALKFGEGVSASQKVKPELAVNTIESMLIQSRVKLLETIQSLQRRFILIQAGLSSQSPLDPQPQTQRVVTICEYEQAQRLPDKPQDPKNVQKSSISLQAPPVLHQSFGLQEKHSVNYSQNVQQVQTSSLNTCAQNFHVQLKNNQDFPEHECMGPVFSGQDTYPCTPSKSKIQKSKVIKKRVRNRFGNDTSSLGFVKQYVMNDETGRANQLFKCVHCNIKTPKLCNMIDHQKTHRQERSYECPQCHHTFTQAANRDRHINGGSCQHF